MSEVDEAVTRLRARWDGERRGAVSLEVVDREAGVWSIVLDHPTARNALSLSMMVSLGEVAQRLEAEPSVGTVLVRSSGGVFCSGGDLGQVATRLLSREAGQEMASAMRRITDAIHDLPAVVIAWVEGAAVGGGAELLSMADRRVVTPDAGMWFRQGPLGVACGWGGARRLVAQVGSARAMTWLTSGERVAAPELVAAGYAEWSPDPTTGWREVVRRASKVPVAARRALKGQVVAARQGQAPEAQDRRFAEVWAGSAHRAALAAAGWTVREPAEG